MSVFNPEQFFKRRTIFSIENFGPWDQNFQDQNSRDRPVCFLWLQLILGTVSLNHGLEWIFAGTIPVELWNQNSLSYGVWGQAFFDVDYIASPFLEHNLIL